MPAHARSVRHTQPVDKHISSAPQSALVRQMHVAATPQRRRPLAVHCESSAHSTHAPPTQTRAPAAVQSASRAHSTQRSGAPHATSISGSQSPLHTLPAAQSAVASHDS
jgi:hypothetical protein